jgi:hypothetical protein
LCQTQAIGGRAYCEVFFLEENDSEVNDLLNWTKTEYGQREVPGLDKTRNVVWMDQDWWATYLAGPNFEEGERRISILTNVSEKDCKLIAFSKLLMRLEGLQLPAQA